MITKALGSGLDLKLANTMRERERPILKGLLGDSVNNNFHFKSNNDNDEDTVVPHVITIICISLGSMCEYVSVSKSTYSFTLPGVRMYIDVDTYMLCCMGRSGEREMICCSNVTP